MSQNTRFVGLDVHAATIAVAVADQGVEAVEAVGTIPHTPDAVTRLMRKLGPASALRQPLVFVRGLQKRIGPKSSVQRPRSLAPRRLSPARALWALVLAREKTARLRTAERARQRGLVVVCDRYPQSQVLGFNDGPLLSPWLESPAGWKRRLARYELGAYQSAGRLAPNLAVKLDISPEVAVRRKPDMTIEECTRRRAAVRASRRGRASP